MRDTLRRATVVLAAAAALAGCRTEVVVPQPRVERELAVALEAARLRRVVDHVLAFREGLLREAVDRGRIDHADRAAAARFVMADLGARLDALDDGRLDADGAVDRDLSRLLLERSEAAIAAADADEDRLRALAAPATALEWLAFRGPPDAAAADRLATLLREKPGSEKEGGGAVDGRWTTATPSDLRLAARRLKAAADLLVRRSTEVAVLDPDARGGLPGAAKAHAGWLRQRAGDAERRAKEAAKGASDLPSPIGRDAFVVRLRTQHGVEETPATIAAFGRALLVEVRAEIDALVAAHWPGLDWKQALEKVRDDHAPPHAVPAEAHAAALAARDFCIERGLVTIPEPARQAHTEIIGDQMARTYPFAAYGFRANTPEGPSGRYLVTPGATWMDAAGRDQRLRGNCRAWTRVVAPHEVWPGHHLQFWYADHHAAPLRRACSTSVYVEGWGLYCEDLLDRHGYFTDPAERLCLLVMRAWRACRVFIDVGLHCEGLAFEDAVATLVDNAALTQDAARAEVRRYLNMPTQPFGYAWGWNRLVALRAKVEARRGAAFDERAFHDTILRAGPIPLRLLERLLVD